MVNTSSDRGSRSDGSKKRLVVCFVLLLLFLLVVLIFGESLVDFVQNLITPIGPGGMIETFLNADVITGNTAVAWG